MQSLALISLPSIFWKSRGSLIYCGVRHTENVHLVDNYIDYIYKVEPLSALPWFMKKKSLEFSHLSPSVPLKCLHLPNKEMLFLVMQKYH